MKARWSAAAGIGVVAALAASAGAQDRGMAIRSALEDPTQPLPAPHALVIGIDQYEKWGDLQRAREDATALAALLREQYGFEDVRLLLDGEATRRGIVEALRGLLDLDEPNSVLIYYAGHGVRDEKLKEGYWVPADAGMGTVADYIPNSTLLQYVGRMKARHVTIVSDSCFSGTLLKRGAGDALPAVPDAAWYRKMAARASRYAITSGDLETVPDRSVFSTKLLGALRYAESPVLSVQELALTLQKEVARFAPGQTVLEGRVNDPVDAGGQFVFVRRTGRVAIPRPEEAAPAKTALILPVAPARPAFPTLKGPWENSLGMKFVPVAGTEALFCVWETRVKDFRAFAADRTGNGGYDYRQGEEPYVLKADWWKQRGWEYGWNNPGFEQTDEHPVTCVSYEDAQKFCAWLTAKERAAGLLEPGQTYRLPRDWEWSAAVGLREPRGGTPKEKDAKIPDVYPWGTTQTPPTRWGNYAGEEARNGDWPSQYGVIAGYTDGYARTSPVGVFGAKHEGMCDLGGNVWEWCEDRYDTDQTYRVLRGGSWGGGAPASLLSSDRVRVHPGCRSGGGGFRVALSVSSP